MNIFARHNSYFGNYRNLEMRTKDAGGREIQNFVWDKTRSKGYDALTTAGFDATFPWEKGEAWLEASYLNLCGKDYLATRVLHGIRVKAGVHSTGLEKFSYDVSLGYGNYQDVKSFRLTENKVDLRSRFGYRMNPVGELYLRADWTFETLRRDMSSTASMLWFTPGYRFTYDDWTFDLGAKVDVFIGDVARTRTQIAYPNVFIGYNLLNGDMTLYAKVTGGAGLNAYSDLVLDNHHFTPLYDRAAGSGLLMDTSVERVNASIGVRGHIRNRFQYDVHTGYSFVGNGLLDGLALADPDGNPYPFPMPALGYTKYHLFYADLAGAWISDVLKVDARLSIRKTSLKDSPLFAPPLVSGGIGGRYTWLGKITAGLTLDFASSRTAKYAPDKFYRVPGYADLGVYGEYDFNSLVGIWLKAGNLLNMTIQQTPLFTGSGIWFSVGVALSF